MALAAVAVIGAGVFGLCQLQARNGVELAIDLLRPDAEISYRRIISIPLRGEVIIDQVNVKPREQDNQLQIGRIVVEGVSLTDQIFGGDRRVPSLTLNFRNVRVPRNGEMFANLDARFPGNLCSRQGSWQRIAGIDPDNWVFDARADVQGSELYGEYQFKFAIDVRDVSRLSGDFDVTVSDEYLDNLRKAGWPQINRGTLRYSVDKINHQTWLEQCAETGAETVDQYISNLIARQEHGWAIGNLFVQPVQSRLFRDWMQQPGVVEITLERAGGNFWAALLGYGDPALPFSAYRTTLSVGDLNGDIAGLRVYSPQQAWVLKQAHSTTQIVEAPVKHDIEVVYPAAAEEEQNPASAESGSAVQRSRDVYKNLPTRLATNYVGSSARVFVQGQRDPREGVLQQADTSSIQIVQHYAGGEMSVRIPQDRISRLEVLVTENYYLN